MTIILYCHKKTQQTRKNKERLAHRPISKNNHAPPPPLPTALYKNFHYTKQQKRPHPRTMPLQHAVTYQAFREITNFIRDNGDN
jgi:hypothetical protein